MSPRVVTLSFSHTRARARAFVRSFSGSSRTVERLKSTSESKETPIIQFKSHEPSNPTITGHKPSNSIWGLARRFVFSFVVRLGLGQNEDDDIDEDDDAGDRDGGRDELVLVVVVLLVVVSLLYRRVRRRRRTARRARRRNGASEEATRVLC